MRFNSSSISGTWLASARLGTRDKVRKTPTTASSLALKISVAVVALGPAAWTLAWPGNSTARSYDQKVKVRDLIRAAGIGRLAVAGHEG